MTCRTAVTSSFTERKRREREVLFALLISLLGSPLGAYELKLSSAASQPGRFVEMPVSFASHGTPVAALVFEVEFDTSRLQFDLGIGKIGVSASASESDYTATTFNEALGNGRIGISIYDPLAPISRIPDGELLRLRFLIREGAEGFAYVRVALTPGPDAADASGMKVAVWNPSVQQSGVFIAAARAQFAASPRLMSFGSVELGRLARRELLLNNVGGAGALIHRLRIEPETAGFSFSESLTLPMAVRPNATILVPIQFHSDEPGQHAAAIVVESNAATTRLEIPLSASVVPEGSFAYDSRFLLPAAAKLRGANGTIWRSTMALVNPREEELSAILTLLPARGTPVTRELRIAGGESRYFSDLVAEIFESSDTSGAVVIDSSSPDLIIRSTTISEAADGGTAGQAVPTVPWRELFRTGETAYLAGLEHSSAKHTNLALLNLTTATIAVSVELFRRGVSAGSRTYVLEPQQLAQSLDVFEALEVKDETEILARIRATSPDAIFFAYASTVDRRTGSPVFQSAR